MTKLFTIITSCILTLPSLSFAETFTPFAKFDTYLSSESSAISDVDNHWQGSYKAGGENQTVSVWLEAGVKKNQWSLSTLYREEQHYNYDDDTADFYNAIENDREVATGRRYIIDLEVSRFRAKGLRLAYQAQTSEKFKLSIGGSLFHASNLLDGSIQGFAQANASNDYDYHAEVDYNYDEDLLFDRPNTTAPSGIGVSLDLQAQWQITPHWKIDTNIRDLAGQIRWKNAPYTQATVTSDTKVITDDGFIEVNPTLSGIEGTRSTLKQTIKPSGTLDISYAPDNSKTSYLLKSRHFSEFSRLGIGVQRPFHNKKISVSFWPEDKVLETAINFKRHQLKVGLDNIKPDDVETFWFSWGINTN